MKKGLLLWNPKKYEEAKALFAKQAEMLKFCPWKRSVPLYNVACCEALLGNVDSALAYLTQAVNSGYRNVQHIEQDPDLNLLHGLDAFDFLLSELKENPQSKRAWRHWKNPDIRPSAEAKKNDTAETKSSTSQESAQIIPEEKRVPVLEDKTSELISFAETSVVDIQPTIESIVEPEVQPEVQPKVQPIVQPIVQPEVQPEVQPKAVTEEELYQSELKSLCQMGFTNEEQNLQILKITKGNLSEAVVLLLQ